MNNINLIILEKNLLKKLIESLFLKSLKQAIALKYILAQWWNHKEAIKNLEPKFLARKSCPGSR